jgi:hydroxyacylglutathione hydrolase
MPYEIIPINHIFVRCYLVKTGDSFFMVDTGLPFFRCALKNALEKAGCKKGNLRLIVITHGDFDHTGNMKYLKQKYSPIIIAHKNETTAVEKGDMQSNRKTKLSILFRTFFGMIKILLYDGIKPDIYIDEELNLEKYGIDANIIFIPGHTTGSIGVFTKNGDFFCGDLLNNRNRPEKNNFFDDIAEMDASVTRLKTMNIKTVYPGHGKPFEWREMNA